VAATEVLRRVVNDAAAFDEGVDRIAYDVRLIQAHGELAL
jgi:hypothetical protein